MAQQLQRLAHLVAVLHLLGLVDHRGDFVVDLGGGLCKAGCGLQHRPGGRFAEGLKVSGGVGGGAGHKAVTEQGLPCSPLTTTLGSAAVLGRACRAIEPLPRLPRPGTGLAWAVGLDRSGASMAIATFQPRIEREYLPQFCVSCDGRRGNDQAIGLACWAQQQGAMKALDTVEEALAASTHYNIE